MSEVVLKVTGLGKSYGNVAAIDHIDFELRAGEVLALLGPSGCGKSTTLRLIAGLEVPDRGEISIRGRTVASADKNIFIPSQKRNLGLVFQSYAIWPHMTVAGNVAYPLEVRGIAKEEIRRKVAQALELVDLTGFGDRPATRLSGGQQQRVALARALAYEPDLLLLDEPLSNLDAQLRSDMRLQLKQLQQRLGTTILYVTHDQMEAMSLANRVAVMRDGRIEQIGSPTEIYETPSTYFVHSFVGRVLLLPGFARSEDGRGYLKVAGAAAEHAVALPAGVNGAAQVTIRPEDVTVDLSSATECDNAIAGVVEDIIYCGDHRECILRVGDTAISCDLHKDMTVTRGQTIRLHIKPERLKAWPA